MRDGRPLRFLGLALGGWTVVRVAFLLPDAATLPVVAPEPFSRARPALLPAVMRERVSASAASAPWPAVGGTADQPPALGTAGVMAAFLLPPLRLTSSAQTSPAQPPLLPSPAPITAMVPDVRPAVATLADAQTQRDAPILPFPVRPVASGTGGPRFGGSAWALVRGGANGTVSGGQLGASQSGVRLTYALGESRRFALTARLATPFAGRGREAALGLEWQPTRLPIRLVAERRLVLDGGAGGPMIGAIAGYGPAEIAPAIRIEAYGQAGVIARGGVEGFVDAAARLTHPVAELSGMRIDAGIGAWTSAQRGAARFDIGPTLGLAVPVAGQSLRLSLDWRERLRGAANPGSGPALSIGTNF